MQEMNKKMQFKASVTQKICANLLNAMLLCYFTASVAKFRV